MATKEVTHYSFLLIIDNADLLTLKWKAICWTTKQFKRLSHC